MAMEALSTANNGSAIDIFKHICKTQSNQNVLISPWSISSVMAIIYLGAKGHTAQQIADVFHFNKTEGTRTARTTRPQVYSKMEELLNNPCISIQKLSFETQSYIHSRFQAIDQEINQPTKHVILKSVNQIYADRSVTFKTEFLQSVKKYYNIEPQTVNFQEDAEEARKEINSWVEHQTSGIIHNILSEGCIDSLTQLILMNALYFKGNWAKTFKKEDTTEQPFRMSKNTSKPVMMMFQHNKFNMNYIKEMKTIIIELPFKTSDLSILILLPDDINDDSTGLEMLEDNLTYESLAKWSNREEMEEVEANVYLPKIQLDISYELKALLSNMGITDAFDRCKADFTGMSEKSDLGVSQIFHKCFVDINEEGVEAAALSTAQIDGRSDQAATLFAADHPFLFFIQDNKTQNILFLGRISSP